MRKMRVTGVVTQGASRAGSAEYVKTFKVAYSLNGRKFEFVQVDGGFGDKIFVGNVDNNGLRTNMLDTPLEAQYVRLVPVTCHWSCTLRFELLGCELNGECGWGGGAVVQPLHSLPSQPGPRTPEGPPSPAQALSLCRPTAFRRVESERDTASVFEVFFHLFSSVPRAPGARRVRAVGQMSAPGEQGAGLAVIPRARGNAW
ncbi:milk fat globule EGF and factor V/VIII domain containing [Phyllostomus discolor]|uniref:Milk fat globule EGF and factor V/VIII domain containing n=1 Tax=Phyllostomus discolor TaxID=89673 RepID=A0A833YT21_9CHIR|nr:milk fat globule EGF and factor V/VIII domain containing [Phyllostomus discolor]